MAKVAKGDLIRVHFEAALADGTIFDSSEAETPLEFEAGSEELIPGLAVGVIGMEEGEKRVLTIPPEDGFGERHDELVNVVSREVLPDEINVGDQLVAETDEGEIPVWVAELSADDATIDRNHPLAGQTLTFEVALVAIVAAEE